MTDTVSQRVVTITQDYIIIGKSTKDTEVRINVDGSDYDESRQKVENMIRLAKYTSDLYNGELPLPPYQKKKVE
jgi:ribosomal protein S10